jgi:hypothetical protein
MALANSYRQRDNEDRDTTKGCESRVKTSSTEDEKRGRGRKASVMEPERAGRLRETILISKHGGFGTSASGIAKNRGGTYRRK